MNGPPTELETRQLEQLIQTVDDLRRRVAALERQSTPAPASAAQPVEFPGPPADLSTGLLAALGRLLLGIAGAYLLRAITEAALLPQLAGTIAGLLYAGAWLVSAAGIRSANRLIVAFQALTAALIAGPLLWEAAVRFHSLTAEAAAAALALFIVLGQVVAWRRDLSAVAGVAAGAGAATALVLIIATLNPVPFAIALLIAAAVIEYGAFRDRALALRWVIALAVDFCAFLLMYVATRPQGLPEGYAAVPIPTLIAIQITLMAIYLASTVTRTLVRRLPIAWFEVAQLAIAITLAIGCGLRVAHGAGVIAMGAACLAAGAFGYFAAFANRSISRRNFHAYATFAALLVSIGSILALSPLPRTVLWSVLALIGIAFGERTRGNTLRTHGALYLVAASFLSGLLAYWPPVTTSTILCASSAVIAYGLVLRLRKARLLLWTERVSASILAALVCWSTMGLIMGSLIGVRFDPLLVSTLRTAWVAVVAIALAWCGRRWNLKELVWILYPWMMFGALKLFAEDFRLGRPATLFVSLLLYGGTLIALPRLLRRATPARSDLS